MWESEVRDIRNGDCWQRAGVSVMCLPIAKLGRSRPIDLVLDINLTLLSARKNGGRSVLGLGWGRHFMLSFRSVALLAIRLTGIFAIAVAIGAPVYAAARDERRDERDRSAASDDANSEEALGGPADESVVERNLFSIIRKGGVMMAPILACSFLTLVFVFERFISLRRGRVIPAPFVKRFLHQLREGKLDKEEALEMCRESPSPVGDVFAGAVKRWGRPTVEVEQAVLDSLERAAIGLRRYLRLLNAVANVGPLCGLLGTVIGMIKLFGEIGKTDAMGRSELLAGGISEALLATAGGLSVAIPSLCFYVYFASRVERLGHDMDLLGQEVVGLISAEGLAEAKSARASRRAAAA